MQFAGEAVGAMHVAATAVSKSTGSENVTCTLVVSGTELARVPGLTVTTCGANASDAPLTVAEINGDGKPV
jgi:hypothetical protein